MAKPWDKLREPPVKRPLGAGLWRTSKLSANVYLREVGQTTAKLYIGSSLFDTSSQMFSVEDLQELHEFIGELIQQLKES